MKKASKKIAAFALSLFALASFAIPAIATESVFAETQATSVEHLSMTDIEDDLQDIDKTAYPYDKKGRAEIIRFQEYCYTAQVGSAEMYGIYLYVYNPTEKKVRATSNTVNMAVAYDDDGNPIQYENIPLTLLDKTEDNRFIKFKVTDSASILKKVNVYAMKHDGERRYDVADINLYFLDSSSATAANVSKSYVWTGFAAGMNNNEESTLACDVEILETLTLDVKHTYYREKTSEAVFKTDTIHSVYFSVPNDVLDAYGALYRIHAEYLGARLKPALVCGYENQYNEIARFLWQDLSSYNEEFDWQVGANFQRQEVIGNDYSVEYMLNYKSKDTKYLAPTLSEDVLSNIYEKNPTKCDSLYLLFRPEKFGDNAADEYCVSSAEIQKEMEVSAKNQMSSGNVFGAEGEYSKDIFSSIDEKKTELYLTADDTFDLTQTIVKQTWWEKLWGLEGSQAEINKIFTDQPVIYKVSDSDFGYSDDVNAQRLFVAEEDFSDFESSYIDAKANDESLFLFRYRTSTYEAYEAAFFIESQTLERFNFYGTNGYFFEQDVDLDFDIIDVMFRTEEGEETIIPVVSAPADFIPSSTSPNNPTPDDVKKDFWTRLKEFLFGAEGEPWPWYTIVAVSILGYLLLCWIGCKKYPEVPFLLAGFPGLWYVITLPIRAIVWIVRKIKEKG